MFLLHIHPSTQEQFTKKIESLERLLKEERERAKAAEKQVEKRLEEQTAITDDAKIWYREKDLLQQEVGSTSGFDF